MTSSFAFRIREIFIKAKIHCTWLMRKTFAIWIYGIKQNKTEKKKTKYENKIERNVHEIISFIV